jgi:hypothetical protein
MTCPGCCATLSVITQAFQNDQPCPSCGLSASAAHEVIAVRQRNADEELKAKAADALVKLGRAETELRIVRYRLQRLEDAVKEALTEEVPDWWEPS